MKILSKIIKKIKDGSLKEIMHEAVWIYRYIKKYRLLVAFYISLYIVSTIFGLCSVITSKYLVDNITNRNKSIVLAIAAFYVGFGLFEIILNAITGRISAKINIKIINGIRADIYSSIINTYSEHITDFHSGDLLNRINTDASTVAGSVIGWVPNLITRLVQFTGAFLIIFYFDPIMALLALASAPITIVVSRILINRMRKYNKEMREVSSDIMSFHEESFVNIWTIKALGLIPVFLEKHKNIQDKFTNKSLEYNRFSVYTGLFMSITGMIVSNICFGWGLYRLWQNYISFGTMVLFLQLSGTLRSSFSMLVSLIPSAISATTSAGRVMAITELPKDNCEGVNSKKLIDLALKEGVTICMSDVNFTYLSGKRVLDNVNIFAKARETVALVGPSGEGKTTALKVILGLLKVSSGDLKIYPGDNSDKIMYLDNEARQLFSYVPQNNMLFAGTIADNLRLAKFNASDDEIREALKVADAYDFVSQLPEGINSKVGERGCNFSEGQLQRLSIARALIRKAPVLLMDEATSALDVETERKVLTNIREMKKDITCIVTTHRSSVLDICDRVYKINGTRADELVISKVMYG